MKVKFALSLVGIFAVHLLTGFIDAWNMSSNAMMWPVIIHMTFVLSVLLMAYTNKLMPHRKIEESY